jgi:hypothetical protein
MNREAADWLLESLRPTRHLLSRAQADSPAGGPEYHQIDRVVREIDELAELLIRDAAHSIRDGSGRWRAGGERHGEGLTDMSARCATHRSVKQARSHFD